MSERKAYDEGYDDGLKRGLEVAERVKMENTHVQRERDWLMKKFAEYASMDPPRPLIIDHLNVDSLTDEIDKISDAGIRDLLR